MKQFGLLPMLDAEDILRGGTLTLVRNDRDKTFGTEDQYTFTRNWRTPSEILLAYREARAAERKAAARTPFAWDARFGYLSPIPAHCGTGLIINAEIHLEGLHLIGDIPPVQSALRALRMEMFSFSLDGIRDAAHVYRITNQESFGLTETDLLNRLIRILSDLTNQELNAREVLINEHPLVLADSISRALAILKSARLLAPWELFDLLSPIRLACTFGWIKGITTAAVDRLMRTQAEKLDFTPPSTPDEEKKRDMRDAALAARINKRFAPIVFNQPPNGKF